MTRLRCPKCGGEVWPNDDEGLYGCENCGLLPDYDPEEPTVKQLPTQDQILARKEFLDHVGLASAAYHRLSDDDKHHCLSFYERTEQLLVNDLDLDKV